MTKMGAEIRGTSTTGSFTEQANSNGAELDPNSMAVRLSQRFAEFATKHPVLAALIPFGAGASIAAGGDRINILNGNRAEISITECKLPDPRQGGCILASARDEKKQ